MPVAWLATACGPALSEPSFPSDHSGPSSYAAEPTMSGGVVAGVAPRTGLKVRPDLLTVPFSLRVLGEEPALLDQLRRRVENMQARLKAATGGVGEARVTGLSREQLPKKIRDVNQATRIDGCLEIPLAETMDYWARAKLVLAVNQVVDEMRSMDAEAEPQIAGFFDEPRAGIKDAERYREQLTTAWVARMRQFIAVAQSEAAPLEIVECSPPTEILEARISIEEVVLDLKPSCKLDVLARGAEPRR